MSFFKIRLRKTDRLWTQHIRIRDNYTCQRCGQVYSPDNCGNLGVSHYWGRGHENVRFDDDNCVSLCTLPCHPLWAEEDRDEYKAFMIKRLGQTGYDLLEFRKEIRKKRDDAAELIILKHLLKQETAGALIE